MVNMFGEKLSKEEVFTLFNDLDCNSDGFITFQEFIKLVNKK